VRGKEETPGLTKAEFEIEGDAGAEASAHIRRLAGVRTRSLKSELGIRPIYHQLEHRADAHVFIAFLAYCLQVTLKNRLLIHAPGLTPLSVFEKLSTIQMVEVWIPMLDGRWLVLPRHTQPETDVQALLEQIRITLPPQPPPRIKSSQIALAPQSAEMFQQPLGPRFPDPGHPSKRREESIV
jgi:hypothetical protein